MSGAAIHYHPTARIATAQPVLCGQFGTLSLTTSADPAAVTCRKCRRVLLCDGCGEPMPPRFRRSDLCEPCKAVD